MVYHLLLPLAEYIGSFRIFESITFRALCAGLTAFLICLVIGPGIITRLREMRWREKLAAGTAGKTGLKGLSTTVGPLKRRLLQTGPVVTSNVALLGDAAPGDIDEAVLAQQLDIDPFLSDGTTPDVSLLADGTTYTSSNPLVVTTGREPERILLESYEGPTDTLPSKGACDLPAAISRARKLLREQDSDLVVGTGGRSTVAATLAARTLRRPVASGPADRS